jgi:glucose-1-phosphate adenylyltransferase
MNELPSTGESGVFKAPDFAELDRRRPTIASITADTYAAVLAGGRGTRLAQLTSWRAKPAVPFGGKHRIIDFALSNCINSGVRRIGVATQYKAHSLIQHLRRGWNFLDSHRQEFLDVLPAQQRVREGWYDGTADALYQNIDILRMQSPRHVLVLAGDHVYKMDYGQMLAEHVERGADLSIACIEVPVRSAAAFGVLGVDDDGRVRSFAEKPAQPPAMPGNPARALVSMGVYAFDAGGLYAGLRKDASRTDSTHDFGRDVIPRMLEDGARVYAHHFAESCVNMVNGHPYWRDVGTVDAYWEANMDLTRVQPDLNMYDPLWPIRTLEEHLPPAKFVFASPDARGQTFEALVSSGCIVSGASIIRSLLFTSVIVERDSVIEDSMLLPEVRVGRGVRLRRVIVDKLCVLPDGFTAGFDRAADAARYHVTEQGVVLITPEMLGQSLHDSS